MEKVKLEHKTTTRCEMIKLKQKKINQMLILAFDSSQKIKMTPSINVFGVDFELLCCVEELEQNTMRTFFKNQDQFYFADANQLPRKSKIENIVNVCLAVFTTSKQKSEMNICDITKVIFQKNTLDNMNRRLQKFDDFDRNLNSTINLLEFALKNKCKQFIFASSMSVYGNSNQKVKEINKKKPISFYGISKSAAEEYVKKYSSKGLSYTILRLFNVYGKAQRLGELKQGMIRIYLTQIFKNKKLVIKGNKNRFRDFLNTLDLLEYINLILFNRKTYNQILNLGFGKKYRISELVNMLKKNNKFKFSVKYIKGTKDDQFGVVANIDKIKKITNYSPKITLDMGIKDILKN